MTFGKRADQLFPRFLARAWRFGMAVLMVVLAGGCQSGVSLLKPEQQTTIDRSLVEYPAGTELKPYITGLTGPTAITFDPDGSLIIAEGGVDGRSPRVFGFKQDGTSFDIYPRGQRLPFRKIGEFVGLDHFRMFGPIGGLAVANGRIYVSHRDEHDQGVITAFGYDGTHETIVAGLPAQGDFSVTDLSVALNGRIYFGMGTATNSGVVGPDNVRWLRDHVKFCDQPYTDIYLLGRRFDVRNPFSGLFGGPDVAVTAPFQPLGSSIETHIKANKDHKPNGAIYSVDAKGGDLRVECHGLRYPVGLAFSEAGRLYMTNQGMKLRGTRPVKDDPDVFLRMVHGQWYGWPDFSANLRPIRDARFQPPVGDIIKSGYRDLSFLIDHESSGLAPPNPNANLLMAEFRPLAGASKFDFAPSSGPFSKLRQAGNVAIVALFGDLAPYDTGSLKLAGPTGHKVMQVNVDDRTVQDFIRNVREGPASQHDLPIGLERPIDCKFGPDGALYILDFGKMDMKKGYPRVRGGTGKIFKLVAATEK